MNKVKEFDAFSDEVPYLFLDRLKEFQDRAKYLLRGRTTDQMKEAGHTITWMTEEYFRWGKSSWVQQQIENGGHILGYLDYEDRTEAGLRYFVDNYAHRLSALELFYPNEENTRPLDALEAVLEQFDLDEESLPDAKPFEYLAVLALQEIGYAVRTYKEHYDLPEILHEDMPMIQLSGISNAMADIVEIICRAEALRDIGRREAELIRKFDHSLPARADELAKTKVSLTAKKAASIRHRSMNEKKEAALSDWEANKASYHSRADYVRINAKRLGIEKERTLYTWIAEFEKTK